MPRLRRIRPQHELVFVFECRRPLKGAIAEAAIALAAIELGIVVLRPLTEGRRYDLVFDIDHACPRAVQVGTPQGAVLVVNRGLPSHAAGLRAHDVRPPEIDAVAAYCQELKRCYWLPIEVVAGMRRSTLRLTPAANDQQIAINFAADYASGL